MDPLLKAGRRQVSPLTRWLGCAGTCGSPVRWPLGIHDLDHRYAPSGIRRPAVRRRSAIAKEQGQVAASVGCALSRAHTGMRPEEMTFAIPGHRLAEVISAVEAAVTLNRMMASYAAPDAKRFQSVVLG